MQCLRPIKAGFDQTGEITFSQKKRDKSIEAFQFECRKCLPCRLNIAREKAIRSFHEAKMHQENIFLTLTYDQEHLPGPKLHYPDFQDFMKSLRHKNVIPGDKKTKISYMVTGEYGEEKKRPHWHALLFNYRPKDAKHSHTSEIGNKVYTSQEISKHWGKGLHDFGTITLDSAGYVARYAAKKLVHGRDQDHEYHPIHKTSSARAIGRSWIEKYYLHTFSNGFVVLPNGQQAKIPRYYVDWCKKHHPQLYTKYVTGIRQEIIDTTVAKNRKEELQFITEMYNRNGHVNLVTPQEVKLTILKSKFKRLQAHLTL